SYQRSALQWFPLCLDAGGDDHGGCRIFGDRRGLRVATFLVQVYVVPPLLTFQPKFQTVQFNMLVDDVAKELTKAGEAMVDLIEDDLECSIASHTAAIVASTPSTLKMVAEKVGALGGSACAAAANLGIYFWAGKARRGRPGPRCKLLNRFKKRRRRIDNLRRAGVDMFLVGCPPAPLEPDVEGAASTD
ncbi:unnamed protein product, partial [Prorocentrum cordatum]